MEKVAEIETQVVPLIEGTITRGLSAEEWRNYINEATVAEIGSILDKGARITEFYNEYWLDRDKWGGSWDIASKNVLGLSQAYCQKYLLINRVFTKRQVVENVSILPAQTDVLALLAKTALTDKATFQEAVKTGKITASMGRDEASALAKRATEVRYALVRREIESGVDNDHIVRMFEISTKDLNAIHKDISKANPKRPSEIVNGEDEEQGEGPEVRVTVSVPKPAGTPKTNGAVIKPAVTLPKVSIQQKPQEIVPLVGDGSVSPYKQVCDALDLLSSRLGYSTLIDMIDLWRGSKEPTESSDESSSEDSEHASFDE